MTTDAIEQIEEAPRLLPLPDNPYTLIDPRSCTPLARLKPFPQSDRYELFYWSDMRGRWRTFGDFGRLRLTLERAHETFREETFTSGPVGDAIFR